MWSRQAGSRSNDLSNVCGRHRCSHYRVAVRVYADVGEIGRPRRCSVRFRSRCRPAIRWTTNCRASAAGGDDRATHYARPSHASVGRDDRRSSDTHATLWDAGRITRPQSLGTRLHVCCSLRVSVGVWLSRRVFVRNSLRGNPRRLFGQLLRRRYRQPKSPVAGWRRRLTAFRTPDQTNGLSRMARKSSEADRREGMRLRRLTRPAHSRYRSACSFSILVALPYAQ